MPHAGGAQHDFDQIALPWHQFRQLRSQRGAQTAIDGATFPDAEDIDAGDIPKPLLLRLHDMVRQIEQMGDAGIGAGKLVQMNAADPAVIEITGGGVLRGLQRHVAVTAAVNCMFGIIEAVDAVTRNAAEEKTVVMVLAAQPAVVIQLLRNMHLVAQRAEFGAAVKRLQQGFFVKFRLGPDQLMVDGLE